MCIKLVRLVAPLFSFVKSTDKFRLSVSIHILKLTLFVTFITVILTIFMQLLLYNLDSNFCFTTSQLSEITFEGS